MRSEATYPRQTLCIVRVYSFPRQILTFIGEAAKADLVFHLADAILDDFTRPYAEVVAIDAAVVDALASGILSSGKGILITTSGTAAVEPKEKGEETDETAPEAADPVNDRMTSERHVLSWGHADKGSVDVRVVRLAPYVYGRGASGIGLFMGMFFSWGQAIWVPREGKPAVTSTVHVEDAAALYLLVAQKGRKGEVYNCTGESDVSAKAMAEAIGGVFGIPVVAMNRDDVEAKTGGFLAKFLAIENRAGSGKAKKELGWEVKGRMGILEEITRGSYVAVAEGLKKSAEEAKKK